MPGHAKRTCYRTGMCWLRAGILCCALLIPLSISTSVLRASPLTHGGPLDYSSDPWIHKWPAFTFRWTPPEGSTEIEETEWAIGFHTAMAEICGYRGQGAEVRGILRKSPYFEKGYSILAGIADKITARKCGQSLSILKDVLANKEQWEKYLGAAYP